ncbi:MAG: DUF790 family protein [Candidatus Methanomethylicaceae archaeon]
MLPSELLVAKTFRGEVKPCYLSPTPPLLHLACSLIDIYRRGIGRRRSEVRSKVRELECGPHNFRIIRGLSSILDRLSTFSTESPVDPYTIRRTLFSLSGGYVGSSADRQRVISEASKELGVPPEWIERYLWSDLEGEQILKDLSPITPEGLLAQYNLSITQTLLFKSKSVEFSADGNWRRIFRAIKRLGLMYTVSTGSNKNYTVEVEGPASLIKIAERYGTSLAKLLPEVLACKNWRITAQIIRGRRLLNFHLSSSDGILFPGFQPGPVTYDSSIEESFARRFYSLCSNWKLLREPDPLPVVGGVILPDFAFELRGRRVYMEIVGFWTPEYIKRKVSKLRSVHGVELIVAVDSSLGLSEEIPGYVIAFTGEVPLRPVLDILDRIEKEIVASEVRSMESLPINIKGACVNVVEVASELGLSKEALLIRLSESPPDDYLLIGENLIRKDQLARLELIISGESRLEPIAKRLAEEGIDNPLPLLRYFGYNLRWRSLDSAEVVRGEGR